MSVLHSCVARSFIFVSMPGNFSRHKNLFSRHKNLFFRHEKKKMDMLHLSSECGALRSHTDSADFRRDMQSKILCISVISVCNDF